eukprot:Pompholyxophrys_punicea_v1_NODE_315_length_2279_cov_2.255845.p1 type:complete len:602 gc:universal NODE_315_length_2279_cov_2.255845:206-2011(+)
MKRFLSGSEKRKKRKLEKIEIEKLPKVSHFFVPKNDVAESEDSDLRTPNVDGFDTTNSITHELLDPKEVRHEPLETDRIFETDQFSGTVSLSPDPALWPQEFGNQSERIYQYLLELGPLYFQNLDSDFSQSVRSYVKEGKVKNRVLQRHFFVRRLANNETVAREWLLYPPSTGKVFCFVCRLFSKIPLSTFAFKGFNDWKHFETIHDHEMSLEHRECSLEYLRQMKKLGKVETGLSTQIQAEKNYWQDVLRRVVEVIKYLASRGLPFRGDNEILNSKHNGNYLGALELIACFDPFLSQHINKFGNQGKGNVSYLSSTICDEFLEIIGKEVFCLIVEEIKKAKYFSISVDSTPDISHVDQLTVVIRYVKDEPVERFLRFVPIFGHTGQSLCDIIVEFLRESGLSFANLRGQSYDNASNMSGVYAGLQAKLKQLNPLAEYIPCAAHSLNLVGEKAVQCCGAVVSFFDFVQKLYTFFSASTHRWNVLVTSLGPNGIVLKILSDTRWSAHADSVKAVAKSPKQIIFALEKILSDERQPAETKAEARGLIRKFEKIGNNYFTSLLERHFAEKKSGKLNTAKCSVEENLQNCNLLLFICVAIPFWAS